MDYTSVLKFAELLVLLSRSINASEALQVPGVVDVVTARDVPGENGKDEQAYAEDKVFLASGGVSGPFAPVIYKKRKVSLQVSSCCNQMKISARTVNTVPGRLG